MKKWAFTCWILGLCCIIACKSDTSQTTVSNPIPSNSNPIKGPKTSDEAMRTNQLVEMDSIRTELQNFTEEIEGKVEQLNATEIELDKAFDLK